MMRRRGFISAACAAGAIATLGGRRGLAAQQAAIDEISPPTVGDFDLDEIEIFDTHVHPPQPMTLSESYDKWNDSFVSSMLPAYEYEGKKALRQKLTMVFKEHLYNMPRQTGYYNYMSRVYGVPPNLDGFNSVVSKGIESGFSAYIERILDREKIGNMVLESREQTPTRPESPIPSDRFVWSYNIVHLLQPEWAREQGLQNLQDVVSSIDDVLERCVADGCVGFKSNIAYYRPLDIQPVTAEDAEISLKSMLANAPEQYVPFSGVADYQDPQMQQAFRQYQDYLLRHIFIKAGKLKAKIIIHTAVGLHPALRFDFNNPTNLRGVFLDDEIKRVETTFLLIHTGYPYHHHMAAMLSQFPNVYTDLSFYSKFPGVLEEALRAFLALAPSEKVTHGSDSNNVPEEIGYCAWNVRQALAKILRDYKENYGWTQENCESIAHNVLNRNARRLFDAG